uniref:DUF7054 domain-containing protein n=1 Tax=Chenopodium quinoa TaxID=63459 RepID=A0A803N016_CHEQI
MPSPNSSRNGILFSPRVSERSMSFSSRTTGVSPATENLRRPKTVPDLKSKSAMQFSGESPVNEEVKPKKLTKVLLNVTIQGSVGAVQYVKEGRRPVLSSAIVDDFDLHYSQFSLESLDREEKIAELGSRNFFLCKKRKEVAETASSCAKQADQATKLASPWLKFISFL